VAPLSIIRCVPRPLLAVALGATVLVGFGGAHSSPAAAAPVFNVNSSIDDHDWVRGDGVCTSVFNGCTLRAAIEESASWPGARIEVNAGTYVVTDQLDIQPNQDVTIAGAGSGRTIISGGRRARVLDIAATARVTIEGVTVRDGKVAKAGYSLHYHGAGIHNHGTLLLRNSSLVGNVSDYVSWETGAGGQAVPHFWGGGGLTNAASGDATLVNVTLWANTTRGDDGAGIENWGRMSLHNVTVGLEWSSGWQAAVHNKPGATLHADNSIFQRTGGVCTTSGQPCVGAPNCSGTIAGNFSIADDHSCHWGTTFDGVDARLGAYDNANDVLPLTAASPALEAGIPTPHDGRDQLGQPRPADADCNGSSVEDLGAVEYQPTWTFGERVFSGCRLRLPIAIELPPPPVLRPAF
jgi:hypothetical protein